MDKYTTSDADAALGNRQYKVRAIALQIMRENPSLTMLEATEMASKQWANGRKVTIEDLR